MSQKAIVLIIALLVLPAISFADAPPEAAKPSKDASVAHSAAPDESAKVTTDSKGVTRKVKKPSKKTHKAVVVAPVSKKERKEMASSDVCADSTNLDACDVDRLIAIRNHPEVIKKLISMIKKDPNSFELHYKLGNGYAEYGMPNKAIEEYNTSIRLKPDYAPVHIKLGALLRKRGNLDGALREFAQASDLTPNSVDLKYELGRLNLEKGAKDKAMEEFKNALKIDAAYYNANIAIADILTENKDYDNAIEELRAATIYSSRNADVHYRLGRIYMLQGNKPAAIDEYKQVKESSPDLGRKLFELIFPENANKN